MESQAGSKMAFRFCRIKGIVTSERREVRLANEMRFAAG